MAVLTPSLLVDRLTHHAAGMYGGEAVTQLEHALQCATLAREDGADDNLVCAALLHDFGHLIDGVDDRSQPHERLAAFALRELYDVTVTEPIRLHVDAKRYLCAVDARYAASLSDASRRSLAWQGGPFSAQDAAGFIQQAHAGDAIRLRRWDDAAKVPGMTTLPLSAFIPLVHATMRSVHKPALQA